MTPLAPPPPPLDITLEEWIAAGQACCGLEPDGWGDVLPEPPPPPPLPAGEPTA
ncbi:MAG: hypothetical protein MUF18_19055 [Fimbriiglobus sp.]|jgi:hypothetical protein|nr:hypothetical protein [Fimbriiglobus sp.]